MFRVLKNLALVTFIAAMALLEPAEGQTSPTTGKGAPPLRTTNLTVLASLKRLYAGSFLWRQAVQAVRQTGRHVLVVTPGDIAVGGFRQDRYAFDEQSLAEAIPVFDKDSSVTSVVVVVNLRLVQQVHDTRLSVPRDFQADLDRILIHEVYGHAVPYLLAGDASGRCADPEEDENPLDACSIARENAVRAELGLGAREDHGLASLKLARWHR